MDEGKVGSCDHPRQTLPATAHLVTLVKRRCGACGGVVNSCQLQGAHPQLQRLRCCRRLVFCGLGFQTITVAHSDMGIGAQPCRGCVATIRLPERPPPAWSCKYLARSKESWSWRSFTLRRRSFSSSIASKRLSRSLYRIPTLREGPIARQGQGRRPPEQHGSVKRQHRSNGIGREKARW